jgi:hypothetical protein
MNELITYATDPVLYTRRLRMLEHLSEYESQILRKIQMFETDDVEDIHLYFHNGFSISYPPEVHSVTHRSA